MSKLTGFSFAASMLLTLLGCSKNDISAVEGVITMDGKPLANATVVFIPEAGGRPAGAPTDENGHYELNFSGGRKGTIPGVNQVRITTLAEGYIDEEGKSVPGSKETVPMQFNQASELSFNVEEGKVNIANFDISSEGKILTSADAY